MTNNLFINANVKQLQTGGSFRILLPFFRASWGVAVLNSSIFNNFHNRVDFSTILEGLRNFGGGVSTPTPSARNCIRGTSTLFHFHVLHLPNIHYFIISYLSPLHALVVRFTSYTRILVQFISHLAVFSKFCYFFILVTFLRHKFHYSLQLLTKLQFRI